MVKSEQIEKLSHKNGRNWAIKMREIKPWKWAKLSHGTRETIKIGETEYKKWEKLSQKMGEIEP